MPKKFLIGNFLPAYGSTFGKIRRKPSTGTGLTPEQLAVRFAERVQNRRRRRHLYIVVLQSALAVALLLSIGVFRMDIRASEVQGFSLVEQEVVQIEEILQTQQEQKPPPPPRPPIPVEVPDDVDLANEEMDFDAVLDLDQALTDLPPPPAAVAAVEEDPEPEIFVAVENPPEMIGGMPALLAELDYPELARRAALEGTVVVRIVVSENGEPSDPTILRSVSEILDNEAKRAVMLQKFKPGRQRGRAVRVYMAIPVVFKLN